MARQISRGICTLCQGEFSKATMTRHLEVCQRRADEAAGRRPGRTMKHFHLLVEGYGLPMYWLHLEVRTGIALADLDEFFRGIWLECCGHLSAFKIEGRRYSSSTGSLFGAESGGQGMRTRLDHVFYPGLQCSYEYDFGTTTELRLRVLAEETREAAGQSIRLLARNTPPSLLCNTCGKPAVSVCTQCSYEEGSWLCADCAREHRCGDSLLLPVVNSPRVGVCGYTG